MTQTLDPRWKTLLTAARTWRTTLIPNTSTGLAAETRVLVEAVDAFPLVHTVDGDGNDYHEPAITPSGRIMSDADFEALADEAEAGYVLPVKDPADMTDDYKKARGVIPRPPPPGGPWRYPSEETVGYPNLVVCDDRVTGQITIGHSRLPVSAILATALCEGWDEVERGWSPTEHYQFAEPDLIRFLYDLLEARGEFARVLLAFANAARLDGEREDATIAAATDGQGGIVKVWPPGPDTVDMPPPWWDDPDLRRPVIDALRTALAALTQVRPTSDR